MSLIIRGVRDGDLAAVGEIDCLARRVVYGGLLPDEYVLALTPLTQQSTWSVRVATEAATHRMLVAERAGRVLGYSYVGPGDASDFGDLYALFVHPECFGSGVAQELLTASLSTLEQLGYGRFLLWVHAGNKRAIRFYEKHGWVHDGHTSSDRFGHTFLRYVFPA